MGKSIENEKGFTLIEVLAALSLFSVVMLLSISLIVTMQARTTTASDTAQLQQDTNILLTHLRDTINQATGEADITIPEQSDIKIHTIRINQEEKDPAEPITVQTDEPIELDIITESKTGHTIDIQTTWQPEKEREIHVVK